MLVSLQFIAILLLIAAVSGAVGGLVYGLYDTVYYHSKRKKQLADELERYHIASMKLSVVIDRLLHNDNHGDIG